MRETRVAYKARLHQLKAKYGIAQGKIAVRRTELWHKIAPLIEHEDDKKLIAKLLRNKNLTPRYW